MIDRLFIGGLLILVLAAWLHVLRSGFLHLFLSGFRSLKNVMFREPGAMKLVEGDIRLKEWKEQTLFSLMTYAAGAGIGILFYTTIILL